MKKFFVNVWTALCAVGASLVSIVRKLQRCYFGTLESRVLSITAMCICVGIIVLSVFLTEQGSPKALNVVWSEYTDFVGQFITLSTKELVALAIGILLIVGDFLKQPIIWLIYCLTHKPDFEPDFWGEANRISKLPVGKDTEFVFKVIFASAVFWYFAR